MYRVLFIVLLYAVASGNTLAQERLAKDAISVSGVSSYYGQRLASLNRPSTRFHIQEKRNVISQPSPYLISPNQNFVNGQSSSNQFQNGIQLPELYRSPNPGENNFANQQQHFSLSSQNNVDQNRFQNFIVDSNPQQNNFIPSHSNSFLSSPDDIHTDIGTLNAYGIPLLSNEGVINHHHPSNPFVASLDDTFAFASQSGSSQPEQTNDIILSSSPQVNNDGFIVNPQPSSDSNSGGFIVNPQPSSDSNSGGFIVNPQLSLDSNSGGSFGLPLLDDDSNSNFNVQGNSFGISIPEFDSGSGLSVVQQTDGGGSLNLQPSLVQGNFGISLPDLNENLDDNAAGASNFLSALEGISSSSNDASTNSNPLGSLTIGQLLMGINGQNGIMVVPTSNIHDPGTSLNNNGVVFTLEEDSADERQDDNIVIFSPTTEPPTTTTRRSSRRTTTRPPDHLRKGLSDLWYGKGQWLGTVLGGMIDFGRIAAEAFKNHTNFGQPSRGPSYGVPSPIDTVSSSSSSETDIFALI